MQGLYCDGCKWSHNPERKKRKHTQAVKEKDSVEDKKRKKELCRQQAPCIK